MRSRDEVLREFPVNLHGMRDSYMEVSAYHVERMDDRIRELEQERDEDQGVIAVWRGRTERAEARIQALEAQLTLPPIREKFVRVSDELVAELKAAPSKPVTVAIVEDGNELHMTFTESQQAASEPVAWAIVNRDGVTMDVRMTWAEAREHSIGGDTLRPLVFGDVAHPSAAAVRDAALEAAAAAFYHEQYGAQGGRYELVNPRHRHVWRDKARAVLTAALTAASEGASA